MQSADGIETNVSDLSRLVVLGGSVAETVYALGLGDNVVATDLSSTYPAEAAEKARLGHFRQLSVEGVIGLNPSLVVSTREVGPPGIVDQLRAAGIPVLIINDSVTWAEGEERIRFMGDALGKRPSADSIVASMNSDKLAAVSFHLADPPRVMFVYARGLGTTFVAGKETVADFVISEAGALNTANSFVDFRQLTAEAVVGAAPDIIVIPITGLESIDGVDGLFSLPGLAQTPAAETKSVVAIEGAFMVGIGPRSGHGIAELAEMLRDESTRRSTLLSGATP